MRIGLPQLAGFGLVAAVVWAGADARDGRAAVALPGVSQTAIQAYVVGAEAVNVRHPDCDLDWHLLAGIAAVETGHGTFADSKLDATGTAVPPIRGPRLDGQEFALIADTDGGALDGDPEYDRAVGPFQFIPGSWIHYRTRADANPQNINDGAQAAGELLCSVSDKERRPLTDPAVEEAAIRAYNNSTEYVAAVRSFRNDYATVAPGGGRGTGEITAEEISTKLGESGRHRAEQLRKVIDDAPGTALDKVYAAIDPALEAVWSTLDRDGAGNAAALAELPASRSSASMTPSGQIVTVGGIEVDSSIADALRSMLTAAEADGVELAGSGYRTIERQRELRVINGCPDVETAPPSSCDVPTALPGRSNHEHGQAIDFTGPGGVSLDYGSPGFVWLEANAARFGFYNLPGEPWHWSVDGH